MSECLLAFIAYLIFILLFLIVAKYVGILDSGLRDLITTFNERSRAQDRYSAFLAAGLIVLRILVSTGLFSFFGAGFSVVLSICNVFDLKLVRQILQDFYDFYRSSLTLPPGTAVSPVQ